MGAAGAAFISGINPASSSIRTQFVAQDDVQKRDVTCEPAELTRIFCSDSSIQYQVPNLSHPAPLLFVSAGLVSKGDDSNSKRYGCNMSSLRSLSQYSGELSSPEVGEAVPGADSTGRLSSALVQRDQSPLPNSI